MMEVVLNAVECKHAKQLTHTITDYVTHLRACIRNAFFLLGKFFWKRSLLIWPIASLASLTSMASDNERLLHKH